MALYHMFFWPKQAAHRARIRGEMMFESDFSRMAKRGVLALVWRRI
jgi:hypothetical protein